MKIVKIGFPVLLAVLVVVVALAPIGPMPGLFIGGSKAVLADVWPDTSKIHEVKLKVSGTLPRVVTIWVVQVDGNLHIVGAKGSGWVTMLGSGGSVQLRIGDDTYDLNATLMTSGWEPVLAAYLDKYRADYPDTVSDIANTDTSSIVIFRLTAP